MDEVPDEHLAEILPLAKKLARAMGLVDYNILQVSFFFTLFGSPRLTSISVEQWRNCVPACLPRPFPRHSETRCRARPHPHQRGMAARTTPQGGTRACPRKDRREALGLALRLRSWTAIG